MRCRGANFVDLDLRRQHRQLVVVEQREQGNIAQDFLIARHRTPQTENGEVASPEPVA